MEMIYNVLARPHLYPLPQERISLLQDFELSLDRPANSVAGISNHLAIIHPLPAGEGRGEGERINSKSLVVNAIEENPKII
jgi:hypothetical protein